MRNKASDNNVENVEDDVRIVKEFIDYAQEVINDMEYERPVDVTVYQKDLTSMANILAEREQDKKRIQELKEENHIQRKQIMNIFDNRYIPKQKVIDKIEELKEVRKIALERKMMSSVESFEIAIGHLEELLEWEE